MMAGAMGGAVKMEIAEENGAAEYVDYMLHNYTAIKRELAQLKLELEHYDAAAGETLGGQGCPGGISYVLRNVQRRMSNVPKEKLAAMVQAGELELKKLHAAIETLDEGVRGVMEDIYLDRLSWGQVCARRYISPNTLNRYKKRGIEQLVRAFSVSQVNM